MSSPVFSHIVGNDAIKSYLTLTALKGTVGNSLLFAGPDGVGKSLFASAFAQLLLCRDDPFGNHQRKIESGNHPDIRVYRPEGKSGMHPISAMRQFNEEVYLAPFESQWKIFIIHDAERMLPYSANALLKTFEEPALDCIIILLSSNPAALIPTVLSRCRKLYFRPIPEADIASLLEAKHAKSRSEAQQLAAMAQGSVGQAVRLAKGGEHPVRKALIEFLAQGGVSRYKELRGAAEQIAEGIEAGKKVIETEMRQELLRGMGDDLSAVQRQSIEKEVEGAVAMHQMQEAQALFAIILGWYRDLQLLGIGGNMSYLMHRDSESLCRQAFERGLSRPIEAVQGAVADARLSLERSTSLQLCLESLFLKLDLL